MAADRFERPVPGRQLSEELQAQAELAEELRQCEQRQSDEQLQQRHRHLLTRRLQLRLPST